MRLTNAKPLGEILQATASSKKVKKKKKKAKKNIASFLTL